MYSPSTIKNYTNLHKIIATNISENPTPQQVLEFTKDKSLSTQKGYLSAMIYYRKVNNLPLDDYVEVQKQHCQKYNESYLKREEELVPWETILQNAQNTINYSKANPTDRIACRNALIATLYTNFPPLRTQEYFQSAYVNTIPDDMEDYAKNTIKENTLFSDGTLILFDYKTARTHKTRILHLPDAIVNKLAEFHKLYPSNYVFEKKYDSSTANEIVTRSLGASCNQLRKSYITHVAKDLSRADRIALAKTMGHLLFSQEVVYNKNGAFE